MRSLFGRGWIVGLAVVVAMVGGAGVATAQQVASPEVRAERLFVRGLTKAFLEDHEAALAFYLEALKARPNEPAILSAAAASNEALQDPTTALYYAEQARRFGDGEAHYHLQLAQLQVRAGHLDTAEATYQALLERFPRQYDALKELAQLQALRGRPREAIATYEQIIDRLGDFPEIRRQILQLYFRLGDEAGTRAALEALIRLEPTNPAPWRLLGQLYLQQDKTDDALAAFEEAHAIDTSDFETTLALADLYRQLGRDADADRLLDQSLDTDEASAEDLLARATPLYRRAATDAEAAEAARRLLERALERDGNHAEVLRMLGDLLFFREAYAEAALLLERAVSQDPRVMEGWVRAAAAFYEAGQPRDAARMADEGLLLFPGQVPLLRLAGLSLLEAGRTDDALAHFHALLAILDEEPDTDATVRAEALAALGLLYQRKDDYAASDDAYRRALDAAPDHPLALNNYAYSLAMRGERLGDARKMAHRAVELDPANPAFLDTLGWVYYKLQRYDEAKKWIEQALALGEPGVALLDHYGDLQARLGDFEAARRYWRQALDLAPGNAALLEKLERQQF